ncbi:54S ribosomal protein L38, mitochondrial [Sorochytrium milnesiophthora]
MIQLKSMMACIDNSGAKLVECIHVFRNRFASLGDQVTVVVKEARPLQSLGASSNAAAKVKKGDVCRAVVVRTRKEVRRPDGRIIRFDDNACVLVNKDGQPLGTRVLGVVANELRMKRWAKVISLAPKVV